ncbi:MAG TPA: VgrG-related protein [Anaerolineaceae bacterium]
MPEGSTLASQVQIKVNGTALESAVTGKMVSVSVDQHVHMPAMFTVRLNDPGLELMDRGPFDLTKEVEIAAEKEDGTKVTLMKGEITAMEPEYQEGMIAQLVVRGFDKSHRLYRETKTRAFQEVKDSDLASQIASSAGLQTQIETTSTVHKQVFQHNQTDLEFLTERAWRIGFECFVSEGKLYFRKPPNSGSASITLTWGRDLQTCQTRMSLAEQVDEVQVRGWDPKEKRAIIGSAESGSLYPKIGEQKDGKTWAQTFGAGKKIITCETILSQSDADQMAAARLDEISGAFIEIEGSAFRRPDIKAGEKVKLEGLGQRMSGEYLVTSANHVISPEGLKTFFTARGSRAGTLTERLLNRAPVERYPGVVVGKVTDVADPEDLNRVKVMFPWMSENADMWARVMAPGAGPDCGFLSLPDVGDEVLVAFEHGNFNQPYVVGGLWNGQDNIPPDVMNASMSERPKVRSWTSRTGHKITMYDNSENKIVIQSQGGLEVSMADQQKTVTITTTQTTIKLVDRTIEVDANGNISIESMGNVTIKASGNINIEASAILNLKGATVNIN